MDYRASYLRYVSDSLLIDKILTIESANMIRTAGIADSLKGIAGSIAGFIQSNVDTSSPSAFGISLLKLMTPAIMFRVSPIIGGALIFASELFGFDIGSIWDAILSPIKGKIESGEQVDPNEIDRVGEALLISTNDDESNVNDNSLFADLHALENEGTLLKAAQWGGYRRPPVGGPWLFPRRGTSFLHKIFGFLGPGRGRNLAVAFVVWFIKTILASAGLLAGAKAIKEFMGMGDAKKEEKVEQPRETRPSETMPVAVQKPVLMPIQVPVAKTHTLKASGRGEEYHRNDEASLWIIPLYGSLRNTLVLWAKDVYPELAGYDSIISNNVDFNKILNELSKYLNTRNPNSLVMPPGFNTRRQVVDLFAGSVAQSLPKTKEEV